jgi:uncharacterized protein
LFGSVARNEATQESDLDFIVDFEGVVTFDRYMDLKIFLEDLFGKKIDLAIEESLKPQIRQKIVEEAITSGSLPPTMSRNIVTGL